MGHLLLSFAILLSRVNLTWSIVPPIGVFMIAGCGADLLINILLTCLGFVLLLVPQSSIANVLLGTSRGMFTLSILSTSTLNAVTAVV